MRCIPIATAMLACVQVIRANGVQAARASLLEIRREPRWFRPERGCAPLTIIVNQAQRTSAAECPCFPPREVIRSTWEAMFILGQMRQSNKYWAHIVHVRVRL